MARRCFFAGWPDAGDHHTDRCTAVRSGPGAGRSVPRDPGSPAGGIGSAGSSSPGPDLTAAIDCPCGRWSCGRGSPTSCLPCEVLMDDGTWAAGRMQQETRTASGHAALIGLIDEPRITAWFYRERGSGRPNEWRWPA